MACHEFRQALELLLPLAREEFDTVPVDDVLMTPESKLPGEAYGEELRHGVVAGSRQVCLPAQIGDPGGPAVYVQEQGVEIVRGGFGGQLQLGARLFQQGFGRLRQGLELAVQAAGAHHDFDAPVLAHAVQPGLVEAAVGLGGQGRAGAVEARAELADLVDDFVVPAHAALEIALAVDLVAEVAPVHRVVFPGEPADEVFGAEAGGRFGSRGVEAGAGDDLRVLVAEPAARHVSLGVAEEGDARSDFRQRFIAHLPPGIYRDELVQGPGGRDALTRGAGAGERFARGELLFGRGAHERFSWSMYTVFLRSAARCGSFAGQMARVMRVAHSSR